MSKRTNIVVKLWRHPRLPVAFAVVTIVLSLAATWSGLHAKGIRDTPAMRNSALTDAATTSELKGQITDAVGSAFSYSHTSLGRAEKAAKERLTGDAIGQYRSMMGEIRKSAIDDKINLATTVTDAGVKTLTPERAELLVFVDQRSSSAKTGQTAYSAATFTVSAVRTGNRWKISSIDTFQNAGS